jgi:predicted metal-dependent hydrolase
LGKREAEGWSQTMLVSETEPGILNTLMGILNVQRNRKMSPRCYKLAICDIVIDVEHKQIKNINLAVYPLQGRVRISAPLRLSRETIREFALSRIRWIRKSQARRPQEVRHEQREYISGEQHYLFGQPYKLNVIECQRAGKVELGDTSTIDMQVRAAANAAYRQDLMNAWYRAQLKQRIPDLVEKWQPVIGVNLKEWRIKKMKTRWGSCNINARRIWLNLELARKPPDCLEYVVVHEMVHLLERQHNGRFRAFMDQFLPDWRVRQAELKATH